jgi:hypothetical protein
MNSCRWEKTLKIVKNVKVARFRLKGSSESNLAKITSKEQDRLEIAVKYPSHDVCRVYLLVMGKAVDG